MNISRTVLLCFLLFELSCQCCHAMWQREQDLTSAAILMYEYPDSALAIVGEIEPRFTVKESEPKARTDSVAHSVFNYYRKHKDRTEKLDMYYILGRFYQMEGEEELA